ncbi:leucine-rich repeats and immunoglobulin-like domains protein lambik isoform X2 [Lycorma delicatula]|uniref:leucine-rich repeats and immunoglobulin-like domains protein lambik isoform X2 n=1 Tax=Lycorma delicatula TaxID=130591 RepID=UPI003F5136E5
MIRSIVFVLFFTLNFILVFCDNIDCPKKCDCLGQFVDCSNRNLIDIPENLPFRVDRLDLSSNRISDRIAGDIYKYPFLIVLKLNKNLLHTVPVINTMNLTTLTLSHNKIGELNYKVFERLPFLKSFDMSSNHLLEIRRGMFPNSTNLEILNLNNNNIAKIENGSLNGLVSLNDLKLNRNNLTALNKDTFTNVTNLKILELSRNHLTVIIGLAFTGLKSLTVLKIRYNNISLLQDGAFWGLNNLLTLQLDDNKITEVSKGWLYGLESLHRLSLSHNLIRKINRNQENQEEGGWEFCMHLVELNLSFNELHEIEVDTLKHLSKLQHLELNDNFISSIAEGAFNHTSSLKVLELNNNNISWTFEDTNGVFVGLKRLTKLGLAGNMITSIPPKAFLGLENLVELNLKGNGILTLQENAFLSLPKLNIIHMNTTNLLCDCRLAWFPDWLQQFSKVNTLQVSCGHPSLLKGKQITDIPLEDFFCSPGDSPEPHIIEEPNSQMALAGADVRLTCIAKSSSESPMTFKWKRNNHEVKEWISTAGGEQKSDLELHNVTSAHSAKYQCIISNAFGTVYSHKAQLNVLVFPVLVKRPTNVTAKVGNTARLECAATGQPPPQIEWQKDGGSEFPAAQERRMHVMPTDDVFFIVNVKAMDTGVYTCTARNAAGIVIANASLTVLEPPSFVKNMEDKIITTGEAIVLECMVSGSPKPNLTWTKDEGPLLLTDRHFFTAEDQLLIIMNSMLSDAGVYECEITNPLGSKKDQSQLTVLPMYGSGLNDENITGVIMMTVVCCAVLTSAIWVVIIYYTRRHLRRANCTPSDNISDHSGLSKDSGAGESTKRTSHEDLLLGTVNCMSQETGGQVPLPEVGLPLLTTIHPYGESNSSSSSLDVFRDGAVVVPCSQPGLVRSNHDRCLPKSYLYLYLPSHQQVLAV